jgi:hypothetical protein
VTRLASKRRARFGRVRWRTFALERRIKLLREGNGADAWIWRGARRLSDKAVRGAEVAGTSSRRRENLVAATAGASDRKEDMYNLSPVLCNY